MDEAKVRAASRNEEGRIDYSAEFSPSPVQLEIAGGWGMAGFDVPEGSMSSKSILGLISHIGIGASYRGWLTVTVEGDYLDPKDMDDADGAHPGISAGLTMLQVGRRIGIQAGIGRALRDEVWENAWAARFFIADRAMGARLGAEIFSSAHDVSSLGVYFEFINPQNW
jgi:hypothetical protein